MAEFDPTKQHLITKDAYRQFKSDIDKWSSGTFKKNAPANTPVTTNQNGPHPWINEQQNEVLRQLRDNSTLTFAIGALVSIYGGLLVLYFYGPKQFTMNQIQTSKARLGELMLGQIENLLTWAWTASAFFGLLVAGLLYVIWFEMVERKNK